jgi:hypothetical protein
MKPSARPPIDTHEAFDRAFSPGIISLLPFEQVRAKVYSV